jgi:hypothetical protein
LAFWIRSGYIQYSYGRFDPAATEPGRYALEQLTVITVSQLIADDRWSIAEKPTEAGMALLRFRTLVRDTETRDHDQLLRIVWQYDDEGSGELPGLEVSDQLAAFENAICEAFEYDAHAVLTAVLTLDGARQWVFYTSDVPECGVRLSRMPHQSGAYPIELDTRPDPAWEYLRNEILGCIHPSAEQEA